MSKNKTNKCLLANKVLYLKKLKVFYTKVQIITYIHKLFIHYLNQYE